MVEVYIRHGQYSHEAGGDLTEEGVQQAKAAAKYLQDNFPEGFDITIHSERRRAVHTAEVLDLPGVVWEADQRLNEATWPLPWPTESSSYREMRNFSYTCCMITLAEARRLQDERKAQAQALLAHFRFQELFSEFGHYEVRGSYAHDLMLKPDIDGTIYVQEIEIGHILQLVDRLVRLQGIQSVAVENRQLTAGVQETNKAGWVVRVKVPYQGVKWNLDVHILKREDSAGHDYLGEHRYSLEQHDAMLLIKAQLTENGRYPGSSKVRGSFASIDIYRAVLEDGVLTTSQMLDWGKTHDYYGKKTAKP